jgi:hypothetical protein
MASAERNIMPKKREDSASRCGQVFTYITINDTFSRGITCKNWACPDCVEIKVNEVIDCLEQKISGPNVFISKIWLTNKRLSNWIDSSKPGGVSNFFYYAFQMKSGKTILISSHTFPIEYDRRFKNVYLKGLRSYLIEHHNEIERTSRSIIGSYPDKFASFVLAKLPKNFERESEYKKLRTDKGKAEWLYINRGGLELSYIGKQFMREHLGDQDL